MKKFNQSIWFGLVVAIIIIIIVTSVAKNNFREQNKKDVAEYLSAINETAHQGFHSWANRHYANEEVYARELMPMAKKLLEVTPTQRDLVISPVQSQIRDFLKPFYAGNDYEGFFIIGPGNINLASSRDENLGIPNVLVKQDKILQRIWAGESVLSLPIHSDVLLPNKDGKLIERRATMFVGTPVKDENGAIIAILTFRIDPGKDFTTIFNTARMGKSGETYCVDRNGRMVSNSRFHTQLSNLGLVKPGEFEILNFKITDPGVNLLNGEEPKLAHEKWPLTKMAQSLTAGKSGVNLQGYRDYRGVPVIGIWNWNENDNFGIVTEINIDDAYKTINYISFIASIIRLMAIGVVIGLTVMFFRNRKKLLASEIRFRSLYENSTMGLYRTTPDGQIILANPALVKMLGFNSFEELVKRDLTKVSYVDKTMRSKFIKHFEKNDELIGLETEWYRKDGSALAINESTKAIRNSSGNIIYYDGTVEDITKRKNAEKEIINLNQHNQHILNSIGEGIYGIDLNGNCTFINPMAANMLGYEIHELIGLSMHDNHHYKKRDGSDYKKKDCNIYKTFANGKTYRISDEVFWRKDGTSFPVEYTSTPKMENGEIKGAVVVFKDITERKKNEEEITNLNQNLELSVEQRTLELQQTNDSLEKEITEREKIQEK